MINLKDGKIDYTYKSLYRFPKDELIAMIWQHRDYIEKLEKALDIACEKLESYDRFSNCYVYVKKEEWKEWLMKKRKVDEE